MNLLPAPECYHLKLHTQLCVHAAPFIPQSSASPMYLPTLISELPSVFDNQIRSMDGKQFHICHKCDAKPFYNKAPSSIPFVYGHKLRDELDLLLSQNIIAPVTTVTEWCVPIVVTPKKNSDCIRICVDLSHLNK